jgi:hypothetical protein
VVYFQGGERRPTMSEKLKPCPFKHDPDTERDVARDNDGAGIEPGIAGGHGVLFVLCPVCEVQGPEEGTPQEAMAAWNRRAPSPAIEKARAALTLAKEGWDKTGEERVVPFLLRRIDEALALLGEVE